MGKPLENAVQPCKCKHIIVTNKKKTARNRLQSPWSDPRTSKNTKYLGVTIDKNLSCYYNINNVTKGKQHQSISTAEYIHMFTVYRGPLLCDIHGIIIGGLATRWKFFVSNVFFPYYDCDKNTYICLNFTFGKTQRFFLAFFMHFLQNNFFQ